MAGLLEQWRRARPSSFQKATVGALGRARYKRFQLELWEIIQKSLGDHPWPDCQNIGVELC